jgi:hypothetical protein
MPVVQRLVSHGHGIDTFAMDETLRLVSIMETGAPECYSDENAHRSHHLPDCPAALRNRRGTPSSAEERAAVRAVVTEYRRQAVSEWMDVLAVHAAALNSLSTTDPGLGCPRP